MYNVNNLEQTEKKLWYILEPLLIIWFCLCWEARPLIFSVLLHALQFVIHHVVGLVLFVIIEKEQFICSKPWLFCLMHSDIHVLPQCTSPLVVVIVNSVVLYYLGTVAGNFCPSNFVNAVPNFVVILLNCLFPYIEMEYFALFSF